MAAGRLGSGLLVACVLGASGCVAIPLANTAPESPPPTKRLYDTAAIATTPGYRVELVAHDLTYPVGVTFDAAGTPYILEAGFAPGEAFTTPRVVKVEPTGNVVVVAEGENPPWTGVAYHQGSLIVAEGGVFHGGRIVRIAPDGKRNVLAAGLPKLGDHRTHAPVVSPDGWVYFGQNAVPEQKEEGDQSHTLGWLQRHPEFGGAVLRVRVEGGQPELVAWGFRNPSGLAFGPNGTLYATDNDFDTASTSLGKEDFLWRVDRGRWYGWPSNSPSFQRAVVQRSALDRVPFPMLRDAPPQGPPKPAALFENRGKLTGLDFSRNPEFGQEGKAFVIELGGRAASAKACGFAISSIDPKTGTIRDFATNQPFYDGVASSAGGGGFERPIDVRFDPKGEALYVVDFGWIRKEGDKSNRSMMRSGALWRIVRDPDARPILYQTASL
jgi:glucose/arabinose dehydrogenase